MLPPIIENNDCISIIRETGFVVEFATHYNRDEMESFLLKTAFVESIEIAEIKGEVGKVLREAAAMREKCSVRTDEKNGDGSTNTSKKQNIISVQLVRWRMFTHPSFA